MEKFRAAIRNIPDFPKKGIVFRDITTLIKDGKLFAEVVDVLAERYAGRGIDKVVCVEARGFLFGGALAHRLGAGVVPVRKKGKLPHETHEATYELEYGTDTLEIHRDAVEPGEKVLVLDDLLATGGTAKATVELVEKLGGEVVAVAFVIELSFLKGREKLSGYEVTALIDYASE